MPEPAPPFGLALENTVPCDRHLRRKLQTFDKAQLQRLLGNTVTTLREEIPNAGDSIAMDVKHIYAWVRENNPREHIPHRFDPARQPQGDPDCKLGVNESHNQGQPVAPGDTASAKPKTEQKEYVWG